MTDHSPLLDQVANYYTDKVRTHGTTPRGVDWSTAEGQERRFAQLLAVVEPRPHTSVIEIGCGYGALAHYLRKTLGSLRYTGYDISQEMIAHARVHCAELPDVAFHCAPEPCALADYVLASGIFNVRFEINDAQWLAYVRDTIRMMVRNARAGVAFNCLTSFSDVDRMEDRLWYPDPGSMLNWCLSEFGRCVSLAHDYGMYEFTVRIRRSDG